MIDAKARELEVVKCPCGAGVCDKAGIRGLTQSNTAMTLDDAKDVLLAIKAYKAMIDAGMNFFDGEEAQQ